MPASDRRTNWLVVAPVLLYTGLLLLGPILAVVAGAFVEGAGALLRRLTEPDAIHALKLTLKGGKRASGSAIVDVTEFGVPSEALRWTSVKVNPRAYLMASVASCLGSGG